VGGTDPAVYAKAKEEGRINDLPVNHSPHFAPVLHPTLETGVEAMVAAALALLPDPPPQALISVPLARPRPRPPAFLKN